MTEVVTSALLAGLGAEIWVDGDRTRARVEVLPSFLKPGTDRMRVGVLTSSLVTSRP